MNKNLPSALVAADICILRIINGELCVYLTAVKNNPLYKNMKCLPGSLIHVDENAENTIQRVFDERTNLLPKKVYIEQLYSFSDINRDKRGRAVAIAYLGLVEQGDDYCTENESRGGFVPLTQAKSLAFDHKEILIYALERLAGKMSYSTIIKKLLTHAFTLTELQQAYELILMKKLDKRNFRKKIINLEVLKETGEMRKEGRMRPAALHTWKKHTIEFFDLFGTTI